jgi:hypothetical protein
MPFCPSCGLKVGEAGEIRDAEAGRDRAPAGRGSWKARLVVAVVLVAIGAIGYALLTRPGSTPVGGTPGGGSQVPAGSTPVPAPITELTITSPTDGQSVATKEVTVIGMAPPGLTVTQDISFGLDQHTTVDGTGHWAIKVGLNDGENRLTFRIGDDASTKKTIRVIYTPPTS